MNELVHHVNQNVQALVRVGLRFREPLHSFDQADFGLGESSYQVSNRAYRGLQSGERGFQFGEALVVLRGCCLKTGLSIQDELHGLFNVHERDYNSPLRPLTRGRVWRRRKPDDFVIERSGD